MSLIHLSQDALNNFRPEQVVKHYANELARIQVNGTAGDYTYTGLLNEFHIVMARI